LRLFQNDVGAAGSGLLVSGNVYWDSLSDSTGYLLINGEFVKGTYTSFLNALTTVNKFRNIIIDLRDNGGGNINVTDSIIQALLPDSTPYIVEKFRTYDPVSRQAKTVDWRTMWTNRGRQILKNKRYAVLANRGSASASEILIAAIKDGLAHASDTALLVGDTTYGKGMGQIIVSRESVGRSDIRITFMRMKGLTNRIGYYHRKGILPDIHVDCDSLDSLIADLIWRMNNSPVNRGFYQARIDTLQMKCDSLNISAALKALEPSAHFHKSRSMQKRNIVRASDIHEAEIIAPLEKFPVK
jgi:C-terminal processing protease CtpA/Prc